jgi:hypothetical protein
MYTIERGIKNLQPSYRIVKNGKTVKVMDFPNTKEDAQSEIARWIEDDQWNAANRD